MQIPETIVLRDKNTSPDERRNFLQLNLELVDYVHHLSILLTLMLHRAYFKLTGFAAKKHDVLVALKNNDPHGGN